MAAGSKTPNGALPLASAFHHLNKSNKAVRDKPTEAYASLVHRIGDSGESHRHLQMMLTKEKKRSNHKVRSSKNTRVGLGKNPYLGLSFVPYLYYTQRDYNTETVLRRKALVVPLWHKVYVNRGSQGIEGAVGIEPTGCFTRISYPTQQISDLQRNDESSELDGKANFSDFGNE